MDNCKKEVDSINSVDFFYEELCPICLKNLFSSKKICYS